MNKPSVVLIGGVAGLLVLGLAVKHFLAGSPEEEAALSREQIAAAVSDRAAGSSGWTAAEGDTATEPHAKAGGSRSGRGGVAGREPRGSVREGGARSQAEARFGDHRARGSVDVGGAGAAAPGGSLSVGAAVPIPLERGGSLKGGPARREGMVTREIVAAAAAANEGRAPGVSPADEEGLVLSLPLKDTTQADAGENPAVEQGVAFASDEGAYFPTDAQFVVPNAGNLNGESGTISFKMEPEWGGDDASDASLVQLRGANIWENRLQIFKNGQFFRFLFTPDSGVEAGVGIDISKWAPGEPKYVTTTWGETPTGEHVVSMYVNGQFVGQSPYQGQLQIPPGSDLRIGSDHPGAMAGARAIISDFKAYDRQLEADRISGLASG